MANGAKLPASGLMTHIPTVKTRKNVSMNSTRHLFAQKSGLELANVITLRTPRKR
jgi:hypothetical protein